MNRAIHGAPALVLSDALTALRKLAWWVSWTYDPDLPPETRVSARCMRDASAALRKAAAMLDAAAGRAEADGPFDNCHSAYYGPP